DCAWITDLGSIVVVSPPAPLPAEMSLVGAAAQFDNREVPLPPGILLGDPAVVGCETFGAEVPAGSAAVVLMPVEQVRVPLPGVVVADAVSCRDHNAWRDELRGADSRPLRLGEEELARPVERSRGDIAGQARDVGPSAERAGPSFRL